MKRLLNILGNGLGVLLLVGLIVFLIFSLNGIRQGKNTPGVFQSPIATPILESEPTPIPLPDDKPAEAVFESPLLPTTTPTLPPVEPEPTATLIPVAERPPLCKFEGKVQETVADASALDAFEFSEPKVIFSREAPIEIIEWLPDNQHLLVHVRDQTKQSIEVLDITTGETEVYAEGLENARNIHWLPNEQAVVYTMVEFDESGEVTQDAIWLNRGKSSQAQFLLDYSQLADSKVVADRLPEEVIRKMNLSTIGKFNPELWRYQKYDPTILESWSDVPFVSISNPQDAKAIVSGPPWLYLVDLKSNQPCEIDFEPYYHPFTMRWSADGRFLAMIVSNNDRFELMYSNKLVILDTETGKLYYPDIKIWSHIWDIAWFPDNRHLVAMGYSNDIEQPQLNEQIGIVNSLTGEFYLTTPEQVFAQGGQAGSQLALSPDGKSLAVNCPIVSDKYSLGLLGQVCVVAIH